MNEVVIPLKIQGIAQMKAELRELKGSIASATDPAQMAALAQRAMQTQTADGTLTISDEEKDQLLAAMNELKGDK